MTRPTYISALKLAWPASVASMATPLLGAVDVWALGRSERPLDIAAVGLGAVIFSLVYWSFGFIRMSVAGLAAQAHGAGEEQETRAVLARGLALGGGLGLALAVLQWPIEEISFRLLAVGSGASGDTFAAAETYFRIRIWGAPFAIGAYALMGWLTARGRTDYLMGASLLMTGLNVALDYWFVVGLGWGAAGVAAGTLIAEVAGFLAAAAFAARMLHKSGGLRAAWDMDRITNAGEVRRTLSVNTDIFIRTGLLALCFAWFVQRGGAFGDVTLAANQTLLQLFLFTGLALDGAAIAAETMVGQAFGDRDPARGRAHFFAAVRVTTAPALTGAGLFILAYILFGADIVGWLAPEGPIREEATRYLPWVAVSPLLVVTAFQLDGVFIGATRSREMRDSMIVCAVALLPTSIWLSDLYGNHGLWAAFLLYFVLRGATLMFYAPRLPRAFGPASAPTASATV